MRADAFLIIVLLGAILSVMMVINNRHTNKNALYLAAFLFILCIEAFTSWNYHAQGNPFVFALLLNHVAPLYTLKAPLLYFFIRGNIRDNHVLSTTDRWHFLPAFLHFLLIIPYLFTPFSEKLALTQSLINHPELYSLTDLKYPYPHTYNIYFRGFQMVVYALLSFLLLLKFKKSIRSITGELQKLYRFSANWLLLFVGVMLVVALMQMVMVAQVSFIDNLKIATQRATAIFESGIFVYALLPVILMAYPRFLYGFPTFRFRKPQLVDRKSTPLGTHVTLNNYSSHVFQNIESLSAEISEYMQREKPFLKSDFKVTDLAHTLQVPPHHIQLCISIQFGKTVANYINEFKIEYACELMRNPENLYSMEGVAEKAGFISSDDFDSTFRSIKGITPRQWYLSAKELN